MNFIPVRCPTDNTVLFEAGPGHAGTSRHVCRRCRKRFLVGGIYPNVEVLMRDAPMARLPVVAR
jgi:hypothetical protein